jgi:GR25 family glycosyltransferase involved in LPS biosynthesis
LKENFIEILEKCLQDLPKSFDFLALYYFQQQNYLEERTSINSNLIHKSLNQYSGAQAILYSLKGAQKTLKLLKDSGIEYTCDCYIFNKSHLNMLEGYSIRPDIEEIVSHEIKDIPSLIDKDNVRNVFNG